MKKKGVRKREGRRKNKQNETVKSDRLKSSLLSLSDRIALRNADYTVFRDVT